MIPHEFARAAPAAVLEELVGREQPIFDRLRVELHLVARDRVDQRADHLVERVQQEGHVQDQRRAQAFRVVRLQNVQDLDGQEQKKSQSQHALTRRLAQCKLRTNLEVANDGFFGLSA